MKIAVIGGGISGLSAAYFLSGEHDVTVFEKASVLGGHAHTEEVRIGGKRYPVDTGFVVFNPPRYPLLTKLFESLGVKSFETEMSMSVSLDNGAFEYNNTIPNGIFADRKNIIRISFIAFLLEIKRFNSVATKALKSGISEEVTLDGFLKKYRFSEDLRSKYLFPMVGAIWSTPRELASDFPAQTLLQFLDNHHLLSTGANFRWSTVVGGSTQYVSKLQAMLKRRKTKILLKHPVSSVVRKKDGVEVTSGRQIEKFDAVVLASHADEVLSLLRAPSKKERAVLSAFSYVRNDVYLHTDTRVMPVRRHAWAAWNYAGFTKSSKKRDVISLTYNMNLLQQLRAPHSLLVTLNPHIRLKKELMFKKFTYSHPMHTVQSVRAQRKLAAIQGVGGVYFAGSYFGYGFHEDGIASALEVAKLLGVKNPWRK